MGGRRSSTRTREKIKMGANHISCRSRGPGGGLVGVRDGFEGGEGFRTGGRGRGYKVSLHSCGTVQYSEHATNAFYLEQQIRIEKQIYFVAIKVFFMPSAFKTDMYMQRG